MALKAGQKAPDFKLSDQTGQEHRLSDYLGEWIVLYFYPKDNTPGCTLEACAFRDDYQTMRKYKTRVLGVSVDGQASHLKFATAHDLPFILLADVEKKVVQLYDVWQEKKMMGRKYMGTARTSYLIDPQGQIVKVYEKVQPAFHAKEVLNDLKNLYKK